MSAEGPDGFRSTSDGPSVVSGKRVTLAELGRVLGLDKSSVSLALRGSPKISPQTRAKVQEAARRYGYLPNLAARQLRGSGPQVLTLVLPRGMEPLVHTAAVATIRRLSEMAAGEGLLLNMMADSDLRRAVHGESDYPVMPDGALVWGDVPASVPLLLASWRVPHVVLDPNHVSYASFAGPRVHVDNAGGAVEIVRHVLARGASRLLFVKAEENHLGHDQRWQACRREWLTSMSLESITFCSWTELKDDDLRHFAEKRGGAVFCSNDQCAMELWHRLFRLGLRVPKDVMLAGFDGDEFGRLIDLTTALFDSRRLAEKGWESVSLLMSSNPPSTVDETIPVALNIGSTT